MSPVYLLPVNQIKLLKPRRRLLLGHAGGGFFVAGGTLNRATLLLGVAKPL
jgi:hypothetical protein